MVDMFEMADGKLINESGSGYDPVHPFYNRDPRLKNTVIYSGLDWMGRNNIPPHSQYTRKDRRENIITKLLNAADYKEKDLIIFNGDMVSEFKDRETIFNGFMKESIELFAKEKPMYYARGNHETRGEFATSFQKCFSPKEPFLYYLYEEPGTNIQFPILVNSNNSVVSVKTDGSLMHLEVLDLQGKVINRKSYSAK